MAFPWTIQRYIFREMGKTFLLTALALTGVVGLGGGLLEIVELGVISPGQLVRIMLLMLPLAASLTLPIAALFSAAATYGRLSADNEFVACRGGGINLHLLFLPAITISLISAAVTFCFSSFVIPGMVHNLESFVQADMGSFVQQRLERPRGLTLGGKFRITADENSVDASQPDRLVIRGIRFVEVDDEQWVRYGTAERAIVEFNRAEAASSVAAVLENWSAYDSRAGRFIEGRRQVLEPTPIPDTLMLELKFLTLGDLLYYLRYPGEWREVREHIERLRLAVGRERILTELWNDWQNNQVGDLRQIVLHDDRARIEVKSRSGSLLPQAQGIELFDVQITQADSEGRREAKAERALIEIDRGQTIDDSGLKIEAYNVTIGDETVNVSRPNDRFGPVSIPERFIERIRTLSHDELMHEADVATTEFVQSRRDEAWGVWNGTVRRIVATINERFAFSISVIFLVLLGAALGVVFRGSHVMVAFGISFVPSLIVLIAILMGKQMAYNATTYVLGVFVIWSGIALVTVLDLWTMFKVLRR